MNRLAGIIVAAVGLLVAVLSIAKIVPGLTQTGVILILLGGLIIGLSFVDKPSQEGSERMSTPNTLINIFFSPAETFRNFRDHPRWLVAVIIMAVLSATYTNLFLYRLTPERVTNYAIDKTLEMPILNDQARAQIEAGRQDALEQNKNPVIRAGQAVSGFGIQVLLYVFLALRSISCGGNTVRFEHDNPVYKGPGGYPSDHRAVVLDPGQSQFFGCPG